MKGEVRIIGGCWRGRQLNFEARPGLRPTPGRARETLFNWLGQQLPGWRCLDLYAGSGALGFEAASRGAEFVTLVEQDSRAFRALVANARRFQALNLDIQSGKALDWLKRTQYTYDLIFLDPPYDSGELALIWPWLASRLNPSGWVYCESAQGMTAGLPWHEVRYTKVGQARLQLFQLRAESGAGNED